MNNMNSVTEYSRIRNIMRKRIARALDKKPKNKALQKADAYIRANTVRDFKKLSEKQQNKALEHLRKMERNNNLRSQRTQTKTKSDLAQQVKDYTRIRKNLLTRIANLKDKPYAIERYLAHAERYLNKNTPAEFKKLNAGDRYNKMLTLIKMNKDPLLTDKGMKAVAERQKEILKRNGYEGGDNWREEWQDLQRRKKEQRQSIDDSDIDEEDMNYWYHSGSPLSNAMADEHNRKLGYYDD